MILAEVLKEFLSTPSGWRATGDRAIADSRLADFYPRPPGGGRPAISCLLMVLANYFYPRPPGGGRPRASRSSCTRRWNFYPRPPGGGRLLVAPLHRAAAEISIHALRVEGDTLDNCSCTAHLRFLSTPSGWRATQTGNVTGTHTHWISIHALRVEGDKKPARLQCTCRISIHALRVEGDIQGCYAQT